MTTLRQLCIEAMEKTAHDRMAIYRENDIPQLDWGSMVAEEIGRRGFILVKREDVHDTPEVCRRALEESGLL